MKPKRLFSDKPRTYRSIYALLLVLCAAPLAVAHYLQTTFDLAPCPLCIAQRYGFWLMGLFALAGLVRGRLPHWADILAVLSGVGAAGVAIYHLWIIAHPASECVKDEMEIFMNNLPTARALPEWFAASGSCTARLPLVYGIQIPTWSLIGLAGIGLLWVLFLLKRANKHNAAR